MIRRRPLFSLLLLALLVLAGFGWHNRVHLQAFPGIISAYSAKEFCSCRYVSGHPADYCAGYVKQYVPLSSLDDNPLLKRVSASALGQQHVAVWRDQRSGCLLLPDEQALPR